MSENWGWHPPAKNFPYLCPCASQCTGKILQAHSKVSNLGYVDRSRQKGVGISCNCKVRSQLYRCDFLKLSRMVVHLCHILATFCLWLNLNISFLVFCLDLKKSSYIAFQEYMFARSVIMSFSQPKLSSNMTLHGQHFKIQYEKTA